MKIGKWLYGRNRNFVCVFNNYWWWSGVYIRNLVTMSTVCLSENRQTDIQKDIQKSPWMGPCIGCISGSGRCDTNILKLFMTKHEKGGCDCRFTMPNKPDVYSDRYSGGRENGRMAGAGTWDTIWLSVLIIACREVYIDQLWWQYLQCVYAKIDSLFGIFERYSEMTMGWSVASAVSLEQEGVTSIFERCS